MSVSKKKSSESNSQYMFVSAWILFWRKRINKSMCLESDDLKRYLILPGSGTLSLNFLIYKMGLIPLSPTNLQGTDE